jgi:hypothetical protein
VNVRLNLLDHADLPFVPSNSVFHVFVHPPQLNVGNALLFLRLGKSGGCDFNIFLGVGKRGF